MIQITTAATAGAIACALAIGAALSTADWAAAVLTQSLGG